MSLASHLTRYFAPLRNRGFGSISDLKSGIIVKSNTRSFLSSIVADSQKEQVYTLKRVVRHPQMRLFQVVSDVTSYSEFIPYCVESTITERDPHTSQPTRAGLKVGWNNIDEMYESRLTCTEPREIIAESLNHNLFKTLYTKWDIEPLKGKENEMCLLKLELKFCFNNPLYNMATKSFGPAFTSILLKAFEERATIVADSEKNRL